MRDEDFDSWLDKLAVLTLDGGESTVPLSFFRVFSVAFVHQFYDGFQRRMQIRLRNRDRFMAEDLLHEGEGQGTSARVGRGSDEKRDQ